MPNLFNHNIIRTYIQNHHIDNFQEKYKVIQGWKQSLQTVKGVNERALQSAFLQGIFGKVLGYKGFGEAEEWNLHIEVSTEVDATTPDGILGFYSSTESNTQAVIELKSPRHSLDKKQKRAGKDYGTPVEQAFSYASKYDRCSWVIVSNMNELRLYRLGRSQEYYESFFVEELDREENFKKFHFLLCWENLLQKDGESNTFLISEKTHEHIQDISVQFYNLYRDVRIQLFEELKENNPGHNEELLLEKAQKFLDRIIFICFCEDMGLLPSNLLHQAIERGKNSFSQYVIWEEIKGVFQAIDRGSRKHNIPAYDGGLFKRDESLDSLTIRNDFFNVIYNFSAYDFSSDLDVNILGHIFEQSISDIEELKANIQNNRYDARHSRRKKEGIYYTPGYITGYIVENSLGRRLEEIKKELGEEELPDIESASTPQAKGKYLKQHLKFYREYEERLKQVKVLDPACGSGAFLNKAFDFLLEEYRWVYEKISDLEGKQTVFNLTAYQRNVLQNNLYGVDLNEESVEITKLSLWLKTANSKEALPYLDNNIKCGDSLIDDPQIAGQKAFNWHEEFPEIMQSSGFDVVIGNPPYVRAERLNQPDMKKNLEKNYGVYDVAVDLFAYFYEKSFLLLANKGFLGFISNAFEKTKAGRALRSFLSSGTLIYKYVDLKEVPVFKGTTTYPVIIIIQNNEIDQDNTFEYIKATGELESPGAINNQQSLTIIQKSLNENNWTFKSIEENELLFKIQADKKTMREFYGKCYYGIKTGLNEAFITTKPFSPGKHVKLLYEGRDIKKWLSSKPNKKLLLFKSNETLNKYGTDISEEEALEKMQKDHPELFHHFLKFQEAAQKRSDKGDFWWELRKCSYYNLFEQPKIIFPNLQISSKFCLDEEGIFISAPAVFLPTGSKSLLAILNSKLIWLFFTKHLRG